MLHCAFQRPFDCLVRMAGEDLQEAIKALRDDDTDADCRVVVGGETIRVHRFIVSVR